MNIEIKNPRDPKKPKRKRRFSIDVDRQTRKTLIHRERELLKKLSYEDREKLNNLYIKVIMDVNGYYIIKCRHTYTIVLYQPLKNGFMIRIKKCSRCHKELEKTIYRDRKQGYPFTINPKNV